MTSRALTDAARKAVWARMERRPFRQRDLIEAAIAAGQPSAFAHRAVATLLREVKSAGAIVFDGQGGPSQGRWSLLPRGEWTGSPIPSGPPAAPVLGAPAVQGPYDPPVDTEGPNSGLTEAFAEELWRQLGGGDTSYKLKYLPIMEQRSWRCVAKRSLAFLFELGFVGPAGTPRKVGYGWTYGWVCDANSWEILDEDGGFVALVSENADVPVLLQAPEMAFAIREVVGRFNENGAIKKSDIALLAASLPEALT